FCFFFQAEDGIRDRNVTGVQTCALPISGYVGFWSFESAAFAKILGLDDAGLKDNNHYPYDLAHYKNTMSFQSFSLNDYLEKSDRSEERRVGKECRYQCA